jgi:hypothetical protein
MQFGGRSSKIEFAKALELFDDSSLAFLKWLSGLRNRVVHDLRHVRFSLPGHVADLEIGEQDRLGRLIWSVLDLPEENGDDLFSKRMLSEFPKEFVALAILTVATRVMFALFPEEHEAAKKEVTQKAAPLLVILAIAAYALIAQSKEPRSNDDGSS